MPQLACIFIFPIKSLDGIATNQATVLESGALKGDREFAIVDEKGKFVNAKRNAAIHRIRSRFSLADRTVTLWLEEASETVTFHLEGDRIQLESWFSDYFGFPVKVVQDQQVGFPDDTASPGPTVISTATLKRVADWFPNLELEDMRLRFRTNLEFGNAEPFWEERLYGLEGTTTPFRIGEVAFTGVNPCQRCVVPTRDAFTGEAYPGFQKTLTAQRQETLPAWVERSRFNHFYRLAVNTRIDRFQSGKLLSIGDDVQLVNK